MGKTIKTESLTPQLKLSECTDGYWLYDYTRGMNLSMRAKSEKDAFVEAIQYYQRRLKEVESNLSSLESKVKSFLVQFSNDDED